MKKANLNEAKILFAISEDQPLLNLTYLTDQVLALLGRAIKDDFPSLRVQLILNSSFKV